VSGKYLGVDPDQEARWDMHKADCFENEIRQKLEEAEKWIATQRSISTALSQIEKKHGKRFTQRVRDRLRESAANKLQKSLY